jgi:mannose-6-phosphate isomerase
VRARPAARAARFGGGTGAVKPLVLPPNVLRHFYAGGARIAALRRHEPAGDHTPEEWIGAVNAMFGSDTRGLSRLEDGSLLRDRIGADPEPFLGPDHVARFGADPGLLVKLLDAGQRLPVHFHPGRAFAREALGSRYGKTEAWVIVEADPAASVHLGFAAPVDEAAVHEWMRSQDAGAMLAAMHELPVAAGDAVFVPAGTPHAIGAGILMVELQEPTDFSVLLEWSGFELTEEQSHLGLGWDRALRALDRGGWDRDRLAALRGTPERLLPPDADPYFRADRVTGGAALEPGYAILVALAGEGTLVTEAGGEQLFRGGDAVLVPHAAGDGEVRGGVDALRCRPPDPNAGEGRW